MSHQTFFPTSNKVDGEVGMVLCLKISTFVKQTPVQDTLAPEEDSVGLQALKIS